MSFALGTSIRSSVRTWTPSGASFGLSHGGVPGFFGVDSIDFHDFNSFESLSRPLMKSLRCLAATDPCLGGSMPRQTCRRGWCPRPRPCACPAGSRCSSPWPPWARRRPDMAPAASGWAIRPPFWGRQSPTCMVKRQPGFFTATLTAASDSFSQACWICSCLGTGAVAKAS